MTDNEKIIPDNEKIILDNEKINSDTNNEKSFFYIIILNILEFINYYIYIFHV